MKNTMKNFTEFTIDGKKVYFSNTECFIRIYNGNLIIEDGYGWPHIIKCKGHTMKMGRKLAGAELKRYDNEKSYGLFSNDYYHRTEDLYVDHEDNLLKIWDGKAYTEYLDEDDFLA